MRDQTETEVKIWKRSDESLTLYSIFWPNCTVSVISLRRSNSLPLKWSLTRWKMRDYLDWRVLGYTEWVVKCFSIEKSAESEGKNHWNCSEKGEREEIWKGDKNKWLGSIRAAVLFAKVEWKPIRPWLILFRSDLRGDHEYSLKVERDKRENIGKTNEHCVNKEVFVFTREWNV